MRITKKDGKFYKLKQENEVYGWENGIRLVQIVGNFEDLEEEIGVNDLIHFLNWCVKYRNNFINRSFDSMIAFYKKAMCENEKDKSE